LRGVEDYLEEIKRLEEAIVWTIAGIADGGAFAPA
jgi:hypothetical protein